MRVETMQIDTPRREVLLDVTRQVADTVQASGITDGWALVYCPHTTAGVCINESADPDVATDLVDILAELSPMVRGWRHSEGNSDAHTKAVLVGESAVVPVTGGRLALGTWQGIFLAEFDGPRRRTLTVSTVGN
jgi:secondary thiamine-phosphate synthase enzyme